MMIPALDCTAGMRERMCASDAHRMRMLLPVMFEGVSGERAFLCGECPVSRVCRPSGCPVLCTDKASAGETPRASLHTSAV